MTENKTERTEAEKEAVKQKKLANLKTFKPLNELSDEEREKQRALAVKGGLARQEQVKQRKTFKQQAVALLNTTLSREQAKMIVGDSIDLIPDEDLTVQTALLISALREATENGNVKAMEFIRDSSGNKPKEELTLDASLVTTEQDRKLLENVSNRLNVV